MDRLSEVLLDASNTAVRQLCEDRDQLRADLAAARAEIEGLREVLEVVHGDYRRMRAGSVVSPSQVIAAPEDEEVRRLCRRWGYGAVIARAAYLWQTQDAIGAFVQGPCLGTVRSQLKQIGRALARPAREGAGE